MTMACIEEEDWCNTGQVAEVVEGPAERFVVPMNSINVEGGKGPQFKTNATRSEEREIG
jgi:hypothetical protein